MDSTPEPSQLEILCRVLPAALADLRDHVVILDLDQRVVAILGKWSENSPRKPADLIGKTFREVFGPELAKPHEHANGLALVGESTSYEWQTTDVPWPVYLHTAVSPLRDGAGAVIGLVRITRNVTEHHLERERLQQALDAKEERLHELEQAASHIAAVVQRQPPSTGPNQPRSVDQAPAAADVLSSREREILDFLRRGYRIRSIAETLKISVATVRNHVKTMFRKTGAHSQDELVRMFSAPGNPDSRS